MNFDPLELNYSKVRTYNECPFLFKTVYVDGKKQPLTPRSSLGLSLHKALEAYHAGGTALEDLLSAYDDKWIGAGYSTGQEQMEHYRLGKEMLERFWQEEADGKSLVIAAEKDFEFPWKKWKIKGTIDRIDRTPGGEIEVIDYKTGPEIKTEEQLSQSLQLGIYGAGARRGLGLEVSLLSIWFVAHGKKISVPYDRKKDEEFLSVFEAAGEEIIKGNFAPNHSRCPACLLSASCPQARPAASNNL